MRLLVVTQAVDLDDPVLGFFHAWIERFASETETVEVICLREGRHALPANVRVHSLGKEHGRRTRAAYFRSFLALAWRLRGSYDAVFVHMNQEYLLIAGWLWALTGKRIVFWYNHRHGTLRTRIAASFACVVCYTSPEAFAARFSHRVSMPVGIDTDLFAPPQKTAEEGTVLFLGRLDPVKKVAEFIEGARIASREGSRFNIDIYGDPTEAGSAYMSQVREAAGSLVSEGTVAFHPSVRNTETAPVYARHAIYANLTPPGSFDKTLIEAMASGCIVACANDVVRGSLPDPLISDGSPESFAASLRFALGLAPEERADIVAASRSYAVEQHSLRLLVSRLMPLLSA